MNIDNIKIKEIDTNNKLDGTKYGTNGNELLETILHEANDNLSLVGSVSYIKYLKALALNNKTTIAENNFLLNVLESNETIVLNSSILKSIETFTNTLTAINMDIATLKKDSKFYNLVDVDVILPRFTEFRDLTINTDLFVAYDTQLLAASLTNTEITTDTMLKFMLTQVKHGKIPVFNI